MYSTSDFKKGLKIEIDGTPYSMLETQFVNPGKGQAFTRVKLKNLLNNSVIEKTFKSGDKASPANVSTKEVQYLYNDGSTYFFMDNSDYEQYEVNGELIGESVQWLVEGMKCFIFLHNDQLISAELPNFTELEVTYCEPGFKGNTTASATKSATVSTGAEIQCPLFINHGDVLKIDTRTGDYVERIKIS